MRRAALVLGVVALAALTACTSPDTAPVPTTAADPYVCAGVPQEGTELALGGSGTAKETGSWLADGPAFSCAVTRSGGKVFVTYGDPTTFLSLDQAGQQLDAEPLTADGDGSGYVFGDSRATAMWVCGEHVLAVELIGVDVKGRDQRDDAENLLISMLPWACGDTAVPE